jgi:hypothetical protein
LAAVISSAPLVQRHRFAGLFSSKARRRCNTPITHPGYERYLPHAIRICVSIVESRGGEVGWSGNAGAVPCARCGIVFVAACVLLSTAAFAGSARDYLNAPVDAWLVDYNSGYSTSITSEDGTDISSRRRSKSGQPDSQTIRLSLRQFW